MVTGNANSEFELPKHEAHLIHVQLSQPQYEPGTGKRVDVPYNQSFTPAEFKQMEAAGGFAGYKVEFLHDPSKGDVLDIKRDHVPLDASTPGSISNVGTDGKKNPPVKTGQGTDEAYEASRKAGKGKNAKVDVTKENQTVDGDETWKQLSLAELQQKYRETFNSDDVDMALTEAQLIEDIEERLQFIADKAGQHDGE